MRPFTSVAHELSHIVGRRHAGQNCDGTRPATTRRASRGRPTTRACCRASASTCGASRAAPRFKASAATPYRVIARDLPGSAAGVLRLHELLRRHRTTCASATNFPNSWLSPKGWDEDVAALDGVHEAHRRRDRACPAAGRGRAFPVLTVGAIGRGAGAAILSVRPGDRQPAPRRRGGPVLVGYDAAGAEVTRAALADEVLDETGLHSYTGSVRRAGRRPRRGRRPGRHRAGRSCAVGACADRVGDGPEETARPSGARRRSRSRGRRRTPTATRSRRPSRSRPTAVARGGGSTRAGATTTVLPAAYFAASANARIRVTVNDGFRSTAAIVRPVPDARSPGQRAHRQPAHTGARFDSDGSMSLIGSASTVAGAGGVEPPGLEARRPADRARRDASPSATCRPAGAC